jgi:hypothetical protein
MATEAAWLNVNNWEKEELKMENQKTKRKNERKGLTLTGLLTEGVGDYEATDADLLRGPTGTRTRIVVPR